METGIRRLHDRRNAWKTLRRFISTFQHSRSKYALQKTRSNYALKTWRSSHVFDKFSQVIRYVLFFFFCFIIKKNRYIYFPINLFFFLRLGAKDFTDPPTKPTPTSGASKSLFFPDEAIFPGHPRFKTLTRNIRERRGEKVAINLPS